MPKDPNAPLDVAIHLEGRWPMRGLVEGGNRGRRERFVGWLALLAALERIFNTGAQTPPPDNTSEL